MTHADRFAHALFTLLITVLITVLFATTLATTEAFGAGKEKAEASSKDAVRPEAPREVRAESAALKYVPIALPGEPGDTKKEIGVLLAARAKLTCREPLSYRKRTLPAGTYDLRITTKGGEVYYFWIGREAADAATREGMGIAGDLPTRGTPETSGEAEQPERTTGTRKRSSASKSAKSSKKKPAQEGSGDTPADGEAPVSASDETTPVTPVLALFRLRTAKSSGAALEFNLRAIGGGKLELSVVAGSTTGKATLTLGEPKREGAAGESRSRRRTKRSSS